MVYCCVAAFKHGNHDEAIQLLPQIQLAPSVNTDFKMACKWQAKPSTNVTLLHHIAAYNGWLDIIKTMNDFITYNTGDSEGRTPLYYAAAAGNNRMVEYLITERGCDPTVKTKFGSLPLHIACLHGHLDVTKSFITEQNCDPTSHYPSLPTCTMQLR